MSIPTTELKNTHKNYTLAYLSAALRVSTHPDAEAAGPRSHVLGVIQAFENSGYTVKRFIVGDRLPQKLSKRSASKSVGRSYFRVLISDVIRFLFGIVNRYRAWYEFGGQVDFVYERFATLQSLGDIFKKNGTYWILETSGPFFYEAKEERKSLVLTKLARRIEIKAYQNCDLLVCVSDPLKEIIIRESKISKDKIIVLPNGVNTKLFDPGSSNTKRLFSGFTIGYVGSVLAWQGIDLLLNNVNRLVREGLDIYLVIVGDGPELDNLKRLSEKLDIANRISFVGMVPRDDVPDYIAGFDVGYSGQLPMKIGKMYHSPLKIYEYMAMGKPVIASAYDDALALIKDRETGFLFTPANENSLREAVRDAYNAKRQILEIGQLIRQEIIQHHSWESRVSNLLKRIERDLRVDAI